ncbi:hypothetical protein [Evansella cellulosilytica]|uniref:C4-dicarboxylate ABC transporter n=1 Tax=Evansella cellulosilytica (strain ATCC 21833 / DSM 2522 / FERM P-1141 / JCM 9156 / N-4) TaxID=649639 RepID=E6U108_EVAC2|nr:hypothetical protein [Evansella cellulosilytica]ADU30320.1 hypothetical protein Bcell_2058 [Evansella cellulosilytica DSM 2522]
MTAFIYIIDQFYPNIHIKTLYSILGGSLLVFTLFHIPKTNNLIVASLFILGSICFYLEGIHIKTAVLGFGQNINLLSLFLFVPLIATFMATAGYLSTLKYKVQNKQSLKDFKPYRFSFILTSSIGFILNLGSMAIVKRIVEESSPTYQDQKLTLTIMRGFGFCMLWSPYFVNVGLVLVVFDVSWFQIGLYGLGLSILYFFVSIIMFRSIAFDDDPVLKQTVSKSVNDVDHHSLMPFILFSITLISLSFLLDYFLPVNMIIIVSVVALILPFIWSVLARQTASYVHDAVDQVNNSFYKLKNELAIFISAGYFGFAISETKIGEILSNLLFNASFNSVLVLTVLIVVLSILLAQIGIHPVIIVIGIGSALSPDKFGVSAEYLALVLLVAWTLATQLSPFSGQVLMASNLTKQPTVKIVRQNAPFVLVLAIVLTTAVYCLYLFKFI